jgi:type IV secretion system protein VirB9
MIRAAILSASLAVLAVPAAAQPTAKVAAANKAALREPSNAGFVGAVQVYPYNDGTLYRLYAAPERITDIALQPGETITSVAAGDTVRWTVGDTTSGSGENQRTHIFVKPFSAGFARISSSPPRGASITSNSKADRTARWRRFRGPIRTTN